MCRLLLDVNIKSVYSDANILEQTILILLYNFTIYTVSLHIRPYLETFLSNKHEESYKKSLILCVYLMKPESYITKFVFFSKL